MSRKVFIEVKTDSKVSLIPRLYNPLQALCMSLESQ